MRSILTSTFAIVSVAFATGPIAVSAATFKAPEGCEVYVTAQMLSCEVQQYFTCERDPEGWQRTATFSEDGLIYLGAIDHDTQWVESWNPSMSGLERLLDGPNDPASFSELLESGGDAFDFETESADEGVTRFIGEDQLTGNIIEIDGVELMETRFSIVALDQEGEELWRSSGNEYISPEWRRFLPGTGTSHFGEDSVDYDDSPVDFAFPGEAGYLAINPRYGCGATDTSAPAYLNSKEMPHDHL